MPADWLDASLTVVGLLKINTSSEQDGVDYEELRTVCALQNMDKVSTVESLVK